MNIDDFAEWEREVRGGPTPRPFLAPALEAARSRAEQRRQNWQAEAWAHHERQVREHEAMSESDRAEHAQRLRIAIANLAGFTVRDQCVCGSSMWCPVHGWTLR